MNTRSHLRVDLPDDHDFKPITLSRVTALARMELKRLREAGVAPDLFALVLQGPQPTDGKLRVGLASGTRESMSVVAATVILGTVTSEDQRLVLARRLLQAVVEERYGK